MEHLINKAGRQRMLTERMVKSYVQIVSDVTPQAASGELADAMKVFERQLGELKAAANEGDTRAAIADSERTWGRFRTIVALPCSRPRVHEVRAAGERLVQAAERATAAFVRHATSAAARLVNLAGRQRMLSQRIAKELRAGLTGVAAGWRTLLELVRSDAGTHDQVLASAEDILERMEHVTALYQSLGK